jgi:antibiotic biosynthesis monooxygenase (ABM) superfamily enzyme
MIVRTWHGWTTPENADAYEHLLRTEVFAAIATKSIKGYQQIELVRRDLGTEVEFMTIMRFASIEDVKQFVGEDHERAYVPDAARKVLNRFDERAQHYVSRETIDYTSRAA